MMTRRQWLSWGAGSLVVTLGPIVAAGCAPRPVLSSLQLSRNEIEPNGQSVHDEADVTFKLNQRADVSATLIGPDGKSYVIRPPQTRAPDQYQIAFRGLVSVPGTNWLRVVPDGTYKLIVEARAATGQVVTRQAQIQVRNADTTPPQIRNVVVNPETFSPNGDGIDDTVTISYQLTKAAMVRVYVTDAANNFYLIQAPTQSQAALYSLTWDGTSSAGSVVKDGTYTLHLEATDAAGNFTSVKRPVAVQNGGTPRAAIVDASFAPRALATGMDLQVRVTVRNTGDVPLHTLGPPPSQKYTTSQNFASFPNPKDPNTPLWYERVGVWRVGISWQNAPQAYPVRWGFFEDLTRTLLPGETVTVQGTITVLMSGTQQPQVTFWAGLEQGGVGFPVVQVGQTPITIST